MLVGSAQSAILWGFHFSRRQTILTVAAIVALARLQSVLEVGPSSCLAVAGLLVVQGQFGVGALVLLQEGGGEGACLAALALDPLG